MLSRHKINRRRTFIFPAGYSKFYRKIFTYFSPVGMSSINFQLFATVIEKQLHLNADLSSHLIGHTRMKINYQLPLNK